MNESTPKYSFREISPYNELYKIFGSNIDCIIYTSIDPETKYRTAVLRVHARVNNMNERNEWKKEKEQLAIQHEDQLFHIINSILSERTDCNALGFEIVVTNIYRTKKNQDTIFRKTWART